MSCPVSPCPYCILGLDHSCEFEDIIDAWDVIHDNYQNYGGCEFAFAIKRLAYLWLGRAQELRLPGESLLAVTVDPDRPIRWDPPPVGGRAPSTFNKKPKSSIFAPPQGATVVSGVTSTASSSTSQMPPPPPPPPGFLPEMWPLMPVQEVPEEWPQFDWHTERKSGKKWRPFFEEQQAVLRAAWHAGQMNLVLNVDGYEYDIDLTPGQESQVARHSQFRRRLRVRTEADWSG